MSKKEKKSTMIAEECSAKKKLMHRFRYLRIPGAVLDVLERESPGPTLRTPKSEASPRGESGRRTGLRGVCPSGQNTKVVLNSFRYFAGRDMSYFSISLTYLGLDDVMAGAGMSRQPWAGCE